MSFTAGFALGLIAGGIFGALIISVFTAGKVSDLYDRIEQLEREIARPWLYDTQERVL